MTWSNHLERKGIVALVPNKCLQRLVKSPFPRISINELGVQAPLPILGRSISLSLFLSRLVILTVSTHTSMLLI